MRWAHEVPAYGMAFVDLDGTLVKSNTGIAFTYTVMRELRGDAWLRLYLLVEVACRCLSDETGIRLRAMTYCGLARSSAQRIAADYVERLLAEDGRDSVTEFVESLRRQGTRLVLATGSFDLIADEVTNHLGFAKSVSTKLGIASDGRLSGLIQGRPCVGVEKAVQARMVARGLGVALDNCILVSDSRADLPLSVAVQRTWWV